MVSSFSPFVLGEYKLDLLLDDLAGKIDALTGNAGLINALRVKAQTRLPHSTRVRSAKCATR